jgi:hypothetical protein
MRTLIFIALSILAASCSETPQKLTLPQKVDGGFTRAQGLGLRAVYTGPGKVTVTITEMPPGNAFEALQKWKPATGRVPFHKGGYFGVAESSELDQKALIAFVGALEKTF